MTLHVRRAHAGSCGGSLLFFVQRWIANVRRAVNSRKVGARTLPSLNATSRSRTGRAHALNEDALMSLPAHGLFIVSDGVGGHNAGEIASRMVVNTLLERVQKAGEVSDECWLSQAFQQANAKVHAAGSKCGLHKGMAATLVAAWIRHGRLTCFHAGDSRAYRLRGLKLERLTKDHTTKTLGGESTGMLTRALGARDTVAVEVSHHDWFKEDALLLVSDGVCGPLSDLQITNTLVEGAHDLGVQLDALLDAAVAAGGTDDMTAMLIE